MKKNLLCGIGILVVTIILFTGCGGEKKAFPSAPITITVPFGAGGLADLLARGVAEEATGILGQPVGVVNRTGAGGVVGLTEFVGKEPDGYNVISVNIGLFAITPQTSDVVYKFDNVIPIIGNVGKTSLIVYAASNSGIRNYQDLLEYGKENGINYATIGIGSDHHILQAAMYAEMGINASPVSYDKATEPIASLLGGTVDVMTALSSVGKDYVESGEMIPLFSFNADVPVVYENFGTVPTAVELGHDISYSGFNFYGVPAGTPEDIVQTYKETFEQVYASDKIKDLEKNLNFVIDPIPPEEVERRINKGIEDVRKWIKYVE